MRDEVDNAITQLKELLNKYPNKTLEILQYVFGKDSLLKIINKPTYEDLQQENNQLKEVIEDIRNYVEDNPNLMSEDATYDLLQILNKVGDDNKQ